MYSLRLQLGHCRMPFMPLWINITIWKLGGSPLRLQCWVYGIGQRVMLGLCIRQIQISDWDGCLYQLSQSSNFAARE